MAAEYFVTSSRFTVNSEDVVIVSPGQCFAPGFNTPRPECVRLAVEADLDALSAKIDGQIDEFKAFLKSVSEQLPENVAKYVANQTQSERLDYLEKEIAKRDEIIAGFEVRLKALEQATQQ